MITDDWAGRRTCRGKARTTSDHVLPCHCAPLVIHVISTSSPRVLPTDRKEKWACRPETSCRDQHRGYRYPRTGRSVAPSRHSSVSCFQNRINHMIQGDMGCCSPLMMFRRKQHSMSFYYTIRSSSAWAIRTAATLKPIIATQRSGELVTHQSNRVEVRNSSYQSAKMKGELGH